MGTWDRVRKDGMDPWHRYYWDDDAHAWRERETDAITPTVAVMEWAAAQAEESE